MEKTTLNINNNKIMKHMILENLKVLEKRQSKNLKTLEKQSSKNIFCRRSQHYVIQFQRAVENVLRIYNPCGINTINISSLKYNEAYKNPISKMQFEFQKALYKLKTSLNEKDIAKIYNLQTYAEREIVKDIIVFLYYHPFNISAEPFNYNRIVIHQKDTPEVAKEILNKYDGKIPIIPPETIHSYLPDILMLAQIPFSSILPPI